MKLILSRAISKPCAKCGNNYKRMIELDGDVRICKRCLTRALSTGDISYDESKKRSIVGNYFSMYVTGSPRVTLDSLAKNSGLFDDRIHASFDPVISRSVGTHVLKVDIPHELMDGDGLEIIILYANVLRSLGMECRDYRLPVSYTVKTSGEEEKREYLKNFSMFYERYSKSINKLCGHSARDTSFVLSDSEVTKLFMSPKGVDVYDYILKKRTDAEGGFNSLKSPIDINGNEITIKMKRGFVVPRKLITVFDMFRSFVSINNPTHGNIRSSGNLARLFDSCVHVMNLEVARKLVNNTVLDGYSIQRYDNNVNFERLCNLDSYSKQIISRKSKKKEDSEDGYYSELLRGLESMKKNRREERVVEPSADWFSAIRPTSVNTNTSSSDTISRRRDRESRESHGSFSSGNTVIRAVPNFNSDDNSSDSDEPLF